MYCSPLTCVVSALAKPKFILGYLEFWGLLTLGAHAQRGLQYLVCHSVCLSVCLSGPLFWQYARLKV